MSGYKTYNRFAYEEAPPLLHMFTNIKYVLERQDYVEPNPYLTDIQSSGKVHLLENTYYLPVGFVTDPALAEVDFTDQNGTFQFQNELLSAALGKEVQPWKELHQGQYSITSNSSVTLSGVTGASCSYSPSSSAGRIYYNYTRLPVKKTSPPCIRIPTMVLPIFPPSVRYIPAMRFRSL